MARRTIAEWRAVVFGHPNIGASCKVTLLFLADHMRADGMVSVPRSLIAKGVGIAERRVDDRLKEARTHGLLDRVAAGRKGRTAVYARTFPSGLLPLDSALSTSALSGGITTAEQRAKLTQPRHITTAEQRTTTTYVGGTDRTQVTEDTPHLDKQQWKNLYTYIADVKRKTSPRAWLRAVPGDVRNDTIRDFLDYQKAKDNRSNYTDRNRDNLDIVSKLQGTDKQMLILRKEMTAAIEADNATREIAQ